MKKLLGLGLVLLIVLSLDLRGWTAEGPELKFNPEEANTEIKTTKGATGYKKYLTFGNDRNYFKLGGYGSLRFQADSAPEAESVFTFRRFVLSTDSLIASHIRIYTELEFEPDREVELENEFLPNPNGGESLSQTIEAEHEFEIALEQGWLELDYSNYARFRGGAVLVPIGRFNINHDDNLWNLPRRPLIDRGVPVLPKNAAWDELGLGINGDIELGQNGKLNYQFYGVNGAAIKTTVEESSLNQEGNINVLDMDGKFGFSADSFSPVFNKAKAITGRLMYSPALGHEFGFSGYWGRYTPDNISAKTLTVAGFDTLQIFKNFDFEGEYLFTHFQGIKDTIQSLATSINNNAKMPSNPNLLTELDFNPSGLVSNKQGYWIELRYHIRPRWLTQSIIGRHFSDPQFIPIVRIEQAFLQNLVNVANFDNGVLTRYETQNRRVDRVTAGLAFRLNPLMVFQIAYEYTQTNKGQSLASVTNFLSTSADHDHTFMFGTAFGF